jgi:putative sigma-54 modulation protein
MRVDVTGRQVEITNPLRLLLQQRLAKLERLLNDNAISAHVVLAREKYRHRTEIVIHARGDHVMRGLGEGNAWPISIRQAAAKIEQQAQTLKGKWTEGKRVVKRRKGPRAVAEPPARDGGRVVRARRYPVKPMSVEDAALRVAEDREAFVVFRNADTDAVSILYRRKDGNLGLIEPE